MTRLASNLFYGLTMFLLGLLIGWREFSFTPSAIVRRDPAATEAACSEDLVGTWQLLKQRHVGDKVTDAQLKHGAIAGMIESLHDQHSGFLDPEEARFSREEMSGKFFGIGAILKADDGVIQVESVMPGSPAERSGIRADDILIAVDGKPMKGKKPAKVVSLIRGEAETEVVLTLRRVGKKGILEIPVTRGEIKTESVKHEVIRVGDKTLMRITVSEFHDDTDELFGHAVGDAVAMNADGVILDLRNDPGGRLDAAVKMACRWKSGSPIVYVVPRDKSRKPLSCSGPQLLGDMPTVVLVNGGSASASEVVTGALQDYGKAYVIGEKTFGKGCGQEGISYKDGAQLWLVTFLWETPNGRSIHKKGLMPDEVVKADPADIRKGKDAQLDRAVEYLTTGH